MTLGGPGPLPRSLYAAIDLSFGRGGFNFLEPGAYTLTARLPEGQVLTSAPLTIEVEKPTRAEERAAAELLSPRVGIALTLEGDRDRRAPRSAILEVRRAKRARAGSLQQRFAAAVGPRGQGEGIAHAKGGPKESGRVFGAREERAQRKAHAKDGGHRRRHSLPRKPGS